MQESALRPLGVGDIVDRVFALYRGRPLMFLAIAAIPYLVLVLIVGALSAAFFEPLARLATLAAADVTPANASELVSVAVSIVGFFGIVGLVALGVSLVQSASLIDAAASRYLGRDATVGGALGRGIRAFGTLFAMGILAFLAFCAMWAVLVVVMVLSQQWWSALVGVVGGIVATVYLAASWMVSPAVVILEGAGPIAALRRAWELSSGSRWRILGLIMLLLVLEVVLSSLLSTILLASFAVGDVVQLVLRQLVNLVASIAWAPVYWGTFAVLYYDLRVRREGFDLELAAEALPRAT